MKCLLSPHLMICQAFKNYWAMEKISDVNFLMRNRKFQMDLLRHLSLEKNLSGMILLHLFLAIIFFMAQVLEDYSSSIKILKAEWFLPITFLILNAMAWRNVIEQE